MNIDALLTMVITQILVISISFYFFYRVLTTPPRSEPDSYSDNDDVVERRDL